MSELLVTHEGAIATLTFNRPEYRNALNPAMRSAIRQSLLELEMDERVRCVVLRGAGEHFMAGGDLRAISTVIAFFGLLFPAGAETTTRSISGGMLALLERPEAWLKLRDDPALIKTAVEEIVRWTTPSCYKRRTATRDIRLSGKLIREGDKVTFWEMSANRDERVFERPFEFDVARAESPPRVRGRRALLPGLLARTTRTQGRLRRTAAQ